MSGKSIFRLSVSIFIFVIAVGLLPDYTLAERPPVVFDVKEIKGEPDALWVRGRAINDLGQVVAYLVTPEYRGKSFLYENGESKILPRTTLPNGEMSGFGGWIGDISNSGLISTSFSYDVDPDPKVYRGTWCAFLYSIHTERYTAIPCPSGEQLDSGVVNNSGKVVGRYINDWHNMDAYVYEENDISSFLKDLMSPRGRLSLSIEYIDSEGTLAGSYGDNAMIYKDGEMTLLPGLSEDPQYNRIYDLTQSGIAVGRSNQAGKNYAAFWERGEPSTLEMPEGVLESAASGINEKGIVVGHYSLEQYKRRAAIWFEGAFFDVNDLVRAPEGVTFTHVLDVNEKNMLLVQARGANNQDRLYLLTAKYLTK